MTRGSCRATRTSSFLPVFHARSTLSLKGWDNAVGTVLGESLAAGERFGCVLLLVCCADSVALVQFLGHLSPLTNIYVLLGTPNRSLRCVYLPGRVKHTHTDSYHRGC